MSPTLTAAIDALRPLAMTEGGPATVLVGMSGGVDSSVSAALLKLAGFNVVGGFIKNWSDTKDLATGECAWRAERRDAMRVAVRLGIPLVTYDFEETYRAKVIEPLFSGYAAGETPNPDVLCNEVTKFGLFLAEADRAGALYIAMGHYARILRGDGDRADLARGLDPDKDQSYFLYRVPHAALRRTIFPVGHLRKTEVRLLAEELGIPTAAKPDSQGICFVGKLDMEEFLRKRIPPKPGEIVDEAGNVVGRHEGLDAYTIGQRPSLAADGGLPWFVAGKDVARNRLLVVRGADHPRLFVSTASVRDPRWTRRAPPEFPARVSVQVRYRQMPVAATLDVGPGDEDRLRLSFDAPVKAVAPGQSAVFYDGDVCLGGGEIAG